MGLTRHHRDDSSVQPCKEREPSSWVPSHWPLMDSPCLAAPFVTPVSQTFSQFVVPQASSRREAYHTAFTIFCSMHSKKRRSTACPLSWSTAISTWPTDPYFCRVLRLVSGVATSNLHLLSVIYPGHLMWCAQCPDEDMRG